VDVSPASVNQDAATWIRLRLPAEPDAAMASRHALTEFARDNGATGQLLSDIALAVSEAVSNVIIHAYRDRPRPGAVSVEGEREGNMLSIVVRDDGPGMTPRHDSPGLGFGLSLIAQVTQAMELRARPEGGSELRMSFALA